MAAGFCPRDGYASGLRPGRFRPQALRRLRDDQPSTEPGQLHSGPLTAKRRLTERTGWVTRPMRLR